MTGTVYFISNSVAIKIGFTTDLQKRLATLSCGSSYPLEVVCAIEGTHRHERAIHHDLSAFRLNGEWFRDCREVRCAIEQYKANGVEPRHPNKDRRVYRRRVELDLLEVDLPLLEIDLFRLPMAEARSSYLKKACSAMEAILTEIKRRKSLGIDFSDLVARSNHICAASGTV